MFLKSLEIQGFKSFADKMVFDFAPGVTAIVGPNGSGKSNVVDAIRWVLGEQSAKTLRGSKMEDIIFAGSNGRKPVGMARVTMVLDNSARTFPVDTGEVEVSRTLYRSGESIYMLNRSACRLKDIQELFMDTGLGRDGFSVIGQGKIEEILTLRAEERRGLIEEAAGISKYKYRKREAERRLDATNDDMVRLDDILFELEQRLSPLGEQAEKVTRYRSLKREADRLQLDMLAQEYSSRNTSLNRLRSEAEECHAQALSLDVQRDKLAAEAVQARMAYDVRRQSAEAMQTDFYESLKKQESFTQESRLLAQQIENDRKQLETVSLNLAESRDTLAAAKADQAAMAGKVHLFEKNRAVIKQIVETQSAALEAIEAEMANQAKAIASLEELQFDTFSQQAANNNESTRLTQALSSGRARRERMDERMRELRNKQEQARKELDEYECKRAELETQSKALTEQLRRLADTNADALDKIARINTELHNDEQTLFSTKSRLQTLEEFESTGEGYYQGVQAVLRARTSGKLRGIHGSVLQLVDIPDEYLAAIDNALGGAAQNLVVENDHDAQTAIAWLKKGRYGRATFMPLNLVKGRRQTVDFNDPSVLGLAADLVQYDARYEDVMAQLLGHIWVVRDLPGAVRVSKQSSSRYRFVTLDGEVIAPGGSMTGGFQKKRNTLVTRKKEMRQLKDTLIALNERLAQLNAIAGKEQEIVAHTQKEMTVVQSEIQTVRISAGEYDVRIQQVQTAVEQMTKDMQIEVMDQEVLDNDHVRINEELDLVQASARSLGTQLTEISNRLTAARAALAEAQNSRNSVQSQLEALRIQQASLEEQYLSANDRYAELVGRAEETGERIASREDEKRILESELRSKESQVQELSVKLGEAERSHAEMETRLQETRASLAAFESQSRSLNEEAGRVSQSADKAWRNYNGACAKAEGMQDKLRLTIAQINELFLLTPEECVAGADMERSLTGAQAQFTELRQSIHDLGEINFTALEEYETVRERVAFLTDQLSDLHKAKEKLEAVILEMETTMSRRFKEVFEQVNMHFQRVFTAMFGGGSARLELSVPGRYLETGVEIIAQPPGKGERMLTLLSGGERALTAIALLFSLLEVHPSPFVILDEIEAALDEANVERFASYIGKYADSTQFIVISHRRGTMEAASYLYGVTMDNNGVSRQISVRVSDYK